MTKSHFPISNIRCRRPLGRWAALWSLVIGHWSLVIAQGPPATLPDPLPIRRVVLSPERLQQELKRLRDGVLVQMPRADFEARVQKAARGAARPAVPRLAEARYHAVLRETGTPSLVGSGQWKLLYPAGPRAAPALLPLQPFNLALRQVRFENREALVADFDGRGPALLVEESGEQAVALEWSARGEARPEGLQFDLKLPACPVAVLEIDVPADRAVAALDGAVLSGPHAAEAADRARWKVFCGGRTQVNLLVRPAAPPADRQGPPLLTLVRQKTVQKLSPEGLEATFELSLEVMHPGARELVLECDPELRIRDVTAPHLENWEPDPGMKGGPRRLRVRLREPLREGIVSVSCLAPLEPSPSADRPAREHGPRRVAWQSPGLRLVGAVPRGETLELWLDPEIRVESWDPGSFRLMPGTSGDAEQAGRSVRLTLVGGGLQAEKPSGGQPAPSDRPRATLQVAGADFRARQLAWWQIGSGMLLTLQIGYEVQNGVLFQLPVLLPPDWEMERVEMNLSGLLRSWSVRPVAGRPLLLVDLLRPLAAEEARPDRSLPRLDPVGNGDAGAAARAHPATPGRLRTPTLTVQLRPTTPGAVTGRDLRFPDAVPLGARLPEGALVLDFDEQTYRATIRTSAEPSEPDEEGPWGKQPAYFYRYQGTPVTGQLRLDPRPPELRARCMSEVVVASGLAAIETHLVLEAEAGSTDTVDLLLSAGAAGPWVWRAEGDRAAEGVASALLKREGTVGPPPEGGPVRRAERLVTQDVAGSLGVLAARGPLHAAGLLTARPAGQHWRLTLSRPLRVGEPLRLVGKARLEPGPGGRWEVPLVWVLAAGRGEGEVTLNLAGTDMVQVEAAGLREARRREDTAGAWRTFRYGPGGAALALRGQAPATPVSAVTVDRAEITTFLLGEGVLQHHFRFEVAHWPQETLAVLLPPGTRLRAARVDGHWLTRLDSAELPVPARRMGDPVHRFEVVYTSDAGGGLLWQRLEAPAPQLPVPPTTFRRTWHLPPGVLPLSDRRQQRLPGAGGDEGSDDDPRGPDDLFYLPGLPHPWPAPTAEAELLQVLADAGQSLRAGRAGQVLPLHQVVSQLVHEYLKDRFPLVIDARALREAGLATDSPVPFRPSESADDRAAPWEDRGLAAVAAGSVALLTTKQQRDAWYGSGKSFGPPADTGPLPEAIRRAVAEAAEHGQDPSGRFRAALTWLRPEAAAPRAPGAGAVSAAQPSLELAEWGEWEPVAGTDDGTLIVVHRSRAGAAAGVLTAGLAFLGWRLRRRSWRLRLTLLVLLLAAAGLGFLWLPSSLQDLAWWPLVVGLAVAIVWYLLAARRQPSRAKTTHLVPRGAAGAAVLLLACTLLGTRPPARLAGFPPPQAAAPATVFLVPADEPNKQSVLVPADLLDRLRALEEAPPWRLGAAEGTAAGGKAGPDAVLLSANYEAKVEDRAAEFAAVFTAHALAEKAVLTLPMDGVQLAPEVWLDGARAHPVVLPRPQVGYAFEVKGRGHHKVELRFRVPISGGAEPVVQCSLPPLLQSRLVFHLPAGAAYPQALVSHGAQAEMADAGGKRLEVDLGRLTSPLVLRWSSEGRPAQAAKVQYRAAYLWDLRPDASSLQALIQYQVPQGAVTAVSVALPPELEVRGAEAHRTITDPEAEDEPAGSQVRLKDWRLEGPPGKRLLRLEFPAPVSGAFEVLLDLVPHAPLPETVALPVPIPQADLLPEESFLAYRTQGVEARPDQPLRVTGIPPAKFAPFWPVSSRPDPRTLTYACTVRKDPVLRVHLRRAPEVVDTTQEIAIRVGARRAEVQARATLTAPGRDLAFVEWQVESAQPVTVAAVTGPDVRGWSQAGDRVRVWLGRTVGRTRLDLTAWLPLPPAAAGAEGHLPLPCLHVAGAREQRTTLRLTAVGDRALEVIRPQNLTPLPGRPPSEGTVGPAAGAQNASGQELVFTTTSAQYAGECQVRPATSAAARVWTVAEIRNRKLTFTSTVDYRLPNGELRVARVRLQKWEGEDVRLEAPSVVQRRERRRTLGDRSWTLELEPATVKQTYRLTLSGEMPLEEAAAGVPLPDVSVPGASHTEHWLAVVGGGLATEALGALRPPTDLGAVLASWPGGGERLRAGDGSLWVVTGPEWQIQLRPHGRPAGAIAVQVFLAEHSTAVVDHRRWLHEVVWWLGHEAHTDLSVDFPAAARVVGVSVDGMEMAPLQPEAARLWLPLPGRAGVRRVRVRWLYEAGESLEQPKLEQPRLEGAMPGPMVWTAYVPAGWEASGPGKVPGGAADLGRGAARLAALDLYRAAALLRVSQFVAEQGRDGTGALADAQRRFALYTRHAEQALAAGAGREGVTGPAGRGLAEWREALLAEDRALAKKLSFEEAREAAEHEAQAGTTMNGTDTPRLPERGTPLSWQVGPGGAPPRLHLRAADARQIEAARTASAWWLGLLAVVWFLAMVPFLAATACRFWPEQMALLGALGWRLAGPTFLVLFLIFLGLCARLLLVLQGLRRRRRRPAPSTNVPAGGVLGG